MVFLITGVSSGLGLATARHTLDAAIGIVRTEPQAAAFESMAEGSAHACMLDLAGEDEA